MTKLEHLAKLLAEANSSQNLISKSTVEAMWVRHFADSAQLLEYVPRETVGSQWIDLGSGAGLPGLIIAILRPDLGVTLVESRKRRVEWLDKAVRGLRLSNCSVIGQRLENVETSPFDFISARAFAPLPKLLHLASRFSTSETVWLLPKGRSATQEVQDLPKRLQDMFHVEQSLTDKTAGIVVGHGQVDVCQ
ncbi:MAG: 16S rRNA (guanine(527)-N(7))-methyltransferase RsmG [Citromicrobium sp.]|nr:MAG: 16S rRNA (guanine(527)-N(7))-methyltransferase RsmG [Citromicrobium sp.]